MRSDGAGSGVEKLAWLRTSPTLKNPKNPQSLECSAPLSNTYSEAVSAARCQRSSGRVIVACGANIADVYGPGASVVAPPPNAASVGSTVADNVVGAAVGVLSSSEPPQALVSARTCPRTMSEMSAFI